jgi:predicted nucleic acid-binding protein
LPAPSLLVVLDTSVLFPAQVRDLLLRLAQGGLYEPLWSEPILEELQRNLRKDTDMSEGQIAHVLGEMNRAFPHAVGRGFEGAADGLPLPDEGDRHVVALAVEYEADMLVTANTRHFPAAVLGPLGIDQSTADAFVRRLYRRDRDRVLRAIEKHRLSLVKAPLGRGAYVAGLRERGGLTGFATDLEDGGYLET